MSDPYQYSAGTGKTYLGTCAWCGFIHKAKCPLVRAIEYYEDGVTVKRWEFFTMEALVPKGGELP